MNRLLYQNGIYVYDYLISIHRMGLLIAVRRIEFVEYVVLFWRTDMPFRLQKQYAVLSRRLDMPHPTGGYVVSVKVIIDTPNQEQIITRILVMSWRRYTISSLLDTT
ncbi:hypothetical protein Tco_0769752, partial [Tanacetum coccineum]